MYFSAVLVSGLVMLLAACFSPWAGNGGDGTITLNVGGGRTIVTPDEQNTLDYTITLTGPGGTISKTVKGAGQVSLQVSPGTWRVDIRGYGNMPDTYDFDLTPDMIFPDAPEHWLRALGFQSAVQVKGGASVSVPLEMTTATEVSTWEQLQFVIERASGGKEIIVITGGDISASSSNPMIFDFPTQITLMADKPVTITRDATFVSSFFPVGNNSTLVLGKPGMTGTITIDGSGGGTSNGTLINVNNGNLEMYDGVILTKNKSYSSFGGGAVSLTPNSPTDTANFTMYGGTISNNEAVGSQGGGVSVMNNGGTTNFTMLGGSISGNSTSQEGGGVYVNGGTFNMSGGTIGGNTALMGGGVYIDTNGTFTKTSGGGVIYGKATGSTDPNSNNAVTDTGNGNAAFWVNNSVSPSTFYYRDSTAGSGERLSTDSITEWTLGGIFSS